MGKGHNREKSPTIVLLLNRIVVSRTVTFGVRNRTEALARHEGYRSLTDPVL